MRNNTFEKTSWKKQSVYSNSLFQIPSLSWAYVCRGDIENPDVRHAYTKLLSLILWRACMHYAVKSATRQNISQFEGLVIDRLTFLNNIEYVDWGFWGSKLVKCSAGCTLVFLFFFFLFHLLFLFLLPFFLFSRTLNQVLTEIFFSAYSIEYIWRMYSNINKGYCFPKSRFKTLEASCVKEKKKKTTCGQISEEKEKNILPLAQAVWAGT